MIHIAGLFVSIIANAENRVAVIDTGIIVNEKNAPYLCKTGHRDFTGMGLYDEEGHGTEVVNYIIDNAKTKNFCIVMLKFYDKSLATSQIINNTVLAILEAKRLNIKLINYSAVVLDWEEAKATSFATAIKTGKIINKRFAR